MNFALVIANGRSIEAKLSCTIEEFRIVRNLFPRSVVVEHALARAPGWS